MNFNFGDTAGTSQNSRKPLLDGNKIHTVVFKGCEARTIEGVKEPGTMYRVLDIKFENADGTFTQTYFEPRDTDAEDKEGTFGKQPSNIKSMMLFFKHLIDAVNPTLAKEIDAKTKSLNFATWEDLRAFMVANTASGIGLTTKIFKEYAIGRGTGSAKPISNIFDEYLFFALEDLFDYYANLGSGTVYINISKSDFDSFKVILPIKDQFLVDFHKTVQPLFNLIFNNNAEIKKLSELRDCLLPKLLSGEISINQATK